MPCQLISEYLERERRKFHELRKRTFNHIDKEQIILNGVKNTVSPLADSIKKTIRSRFPAFAYSSLASSSLAA
jgi:hypothetical protein